MIMCGLLTFIFVLMLFLIGLGVYSYVGERRNFNGGICKACGSKLHCFDTDSGGARGYTCEACAKHWCWVSWKTIDKNHTEEQRGIFDRLDD